MKHLVLLGGGHAHVHTLANLDRFRRAGCRVSVVQPSPFHYYSGMGPGLLSRMYSPAEIRFATQDRVEKQGGSFVCDTAVRIDPRSRTIVLLSGHTMNYDILSCNVGSYVPDELVPAQAKDVYTVKPIDTLLRFRERIEDKMSRARTSVAVIGGGPAALETTANLQRLVHDVARHPTRITLFAGRKFMSRFSSTARTKAYQALIRQGVQINESGYVQEVDTNRVVLETGETWAPDISLLALGVRPSSIFSASNMTTGPDGGLPVNASLQNVHHPEIFGGGDCISYCPRPLDKVGVYAVRQNPVLYSNLMAMAQGGRLRPFRPQKRYMLLFNTGDGQGILVRGNLAFRGKWVFGLKDHIDRKFIHRFGP